MKLSDFIVPMSRYNLSSDNIEVELSDNIQDMFGISTELKDYITTTFKSIYDGYSAIGYNIIPMDITSDVNADRIKLMHAICNKFYRSGEIFKLFEWVDNQIRLIDLSAYDDTTESANEHLETNEGVNKTYGKTITNSVNRDEKGMSENSPIDANIDNIVSPNIKSKFTTDNTETDVHSGTDTISTDGTTDRDNSINRKYKNPNLYSKYLEIIESVNIPYIIDKILKQFIWEFNAVR